MVKCKKLKPTEGLEYDYERLYVIPATEGKYTIYYGDTQYKFNKFEIDDICEKFNSVGCTSFRLSKEDLISVIDKLDKYS